MRRQNPKVQGLIILGYCAVCLLFIVLFIVSAYWPRS